MPQIKEGQTNTVAKQNKAEKKNHAHTSMIHKTLHTDQTKYNKNREKKE